MHALGIHRRTLPLTCLLAVCAALGAQEPGTSAPAPSLKALPVDHDAEQRGAPIKELTLDEALRRGRQGNVGIRAAELLPEQARMDVIVAEAGASPMEPYNGATAIAGLGDRIALVVLCASDPYAVVGVQSAFGLQPDIVTGPATNTSAGRELVTRLSGVRALSLSEDQNQEALARILAHAIA